MSPHEQPPLAASAAAKTQKPTRPRSAYNIFYNEERSRIIFDAMKKGELSPKEASKILSAGAKRYRRKHGRIGRSEITKMISAKWKSFSSQDKLSYEIAAEKDMERCRGELKTWTEAQQQLLIYKPGSVISTSTNDTSAVTGCSSQELMKHQHQIVALDVSHDFVGQTQQQQQYQPITCIASQESMASYDSTASLSSKGNCFSSEDANAVFDSFALEAIRKNDASPKLAQLIMLQNVPNLFTIPLPVKADESNNNATTSNNTGVVLEHQDPPSVDNDSQDAKKPSRRQKETTTITALFQRSVDTLATQLNEESTEFIIASFSTNK